MCEWGRVSIGEDIYIYIYMYIYICIYIYIRENRFMGVNECMGG